MDIQGIRPAQTPLKPVPPAPALTPPVVSKRKRSWVKAVVLPLIVLLVSVLLASAAYGGYYWEHSKATKAENDLRTNLSSLQKQLNDTKQTQQPAAVSNSVSACSATSLTLAEITSSGAAGTMGITYSVTNKSAQDCTISGYPTVTLADSTGQQIGQPAQPSSTTAGDTITLQQNKAAYVTVLFPNAANYSVGYCSSTKPAFIKILPVGQTTALQTALTGQTYCPGIQTQAFVAVAP